MLKTGCEGLMASGKRVLLLAPVDVGDFQLLSGEARRMQHDKTSPVGHEVGLGHGDRGEDEGAVARACDARLEGEPLSGVRANRAIGDRETFGSLLNVEIFDLRRIGAPILVAHQKRDAAQDFDAAVAHVAQLAVLEFHGEPTGAESAAGWIDRRRTAKFHGA